MSVEGQGSLVSVNDVPECQLPVLVAYQTLTPFDCVNEVTSMS